MSTNGTTTARGGTSVRANGADLHYVETGSGTPLILLHGGAVSTGPMWRGTPFSYIDHMERLGEHFHVIAPDTRGAGLSRHTGGSISYSLLADDVVALIEVLELDRPLVCGFSDGGTTATVLGIRHPGAARAIVNHAGFDLLDPGSASFAMMRMMFGGSPEADHFDPEAMERNFQQSDQMRAFFETMKADHDDAQGPGYWKTYVGDAFVRGTRNPGYTYDDLRAIEVPTLILAGDRDEFCTVEEATAAYRNLPLGELAILPNHEHMISPAVIETMVDFCRRTH